MLFTAAIVVLIGAAQVARRVAASRDRTGPLPVRVETRGAGGKRRR